MAIQIIANGGQKIAILSNLYRSDPNIVGHRRPVKILLPTNKSMRILRAAHRAGVNAGHRATKRMFKIKK